jgi:hypothetical protein
METAEKRLRRGRATVQTVSRLLPTLVAWVRSQVGSYGTCGEPSGTGAGPVRALRFSPTNYHSKTAPYSVIILPSTSYGLDTDAIVE